MKIFKNNFVVRFILVLFLFGISIGLLAYFSFHPDVLDYLNDFKSSIVLNHNNTFLISILIISSIFLLSLTVFGFPIVLAYLFYEGFSLGYTMGVFISYYGIKGFIFYLLFYVLIKLVLILLMFYFVFISIKFMYNLISSIINKDKERIYKYIYYHFIRYVIVLGIVLVNSSLIYFFSNRIISLFVGLIY